MKTLLADPFATPNYVKSLHLPLRILWTDIRGGGLGPDDIEYKTDPKFVGPKPNTLKMIEPDSLAVHLGTRDLLTGAFHRAIPVLHRRIALAQEQGIVLFDGPKVICLGAYERLPNKLTLELARASYLGRLIVTNDAEGLVILRGMGAGIPPAAALPTLGVVVCLFTGDRKIILTRRSRKVQATPGLRSISASGGVSASGFGSDISYLHRTALAELAQELHPSLGEQLRPEDIRIRSLFVNADDLQVGAVAQATTRMSSEEVLAGRGDDAYEVGLREAYRADGDISTLLERLVTERADWEPMSLYAALICLSARQTPAKIEAMVANILIAHPIAPQDVV